MNNLVVCGSVIFLRLKLRKNPRFQRKSAKKSRNLTKLRKNACSFVACSLSLVLSLARRRLFVAVCSSSLVRRRLFVVDVRRRCSSSMFVVACSVACSSHLCCRLLVVFSSFVPLFVVACSLSLVPCRLFLVACLSLPVRCRLFVVACSLSLIRCRLFVVTCSLSHVRSSFPVRCRTLTSLFPVRCSLFVVACSSSGTSASEHTVCECVFTNLCSFLQEIREFLIMSPGVTAALKGTLDSTLIKFDPFAR
jgi:hypothetical protein